MSSSGRLRPAHAIPAICIVLGLSACGGTFRYPPDNWSYHQPSSTSWHGGYGSGYGHRDGKRDWERNGRCNDDRYNTSNGGWAPEGEDEYDCLLFGDGLKSGRVKNEGAFARNGVCDDPGYVVTTGRARRGSDEYDCTRLGNGLRGVHVRGGYPPYVAVPDRPSQPVHQPRPQPAPPRLDPPAPERVLPEYRGRNVVIQRDPDMDERARADRERQARDAAERAAAAAEQERRRQEAQERARQAEEMNRQRQAVEQDQRQPAETEARPEERRDVQILGRGIVREQ